MAFFRFLLFIPIFVLVSPAFLVLGIHILLMDTDEGPLRAFLARDVRRHGLRKGFRRFMEDVFLPSYGNAVHSFVLGAAGFLVVIVGLRGLGMLPIELVYVALAVEFTMLLLWAVTEYFRPQEPVAEQAVTPGRRDGGGAAPLVVTADDVEKMTRALVDTTAHLALLESRLRVTESRFEQIANLDAALRELSTRLNLLVSDQLNLRVRREFEQILTELGTRAVAHGADNGTKK